MERRVALMLLVAALGDAVPLNSSSTVVTLRLHDFIASTVDLTTGRSGVSVEGGEVFNINSHVGFERGPDMNVVLYSGIQGGDRGAWSQLGTEDDLAKQYGTTSCLKRFGGQVYQSIHVERGVWKVLSGCSGHPTFSNLTDGRWMEGAKTNSALHLPSPGSIALLYIESSPPMFVKLLFLDVEDHSITFRYTLLTNREEPPTPCEGKCSPHREDLTGGTVIRSAVVSPATNCNTTTVTLAEVIGICTAISLVSSFLAVGAFVLVMRMTKKEAMPQLLAAKNVPTYMGVNPQ